MDALVTYDIDTRDLEGSRRLARVAAVCESYGTRMQYSVFECRLSATTLQRFWIELAEIIDHRHDSVHLYQFPGEISKARRTLGLQKARDLGGPWIV